MKTIQHMVLALIDRGLGEGVIARRVGCTQPTINRIKHGADTSYTTGKAIERLYGELCESHKAA